MRWGRAAQLGAATASALSSLAGLSSCLDDLPEATECPPDARREAVGCFKPIADAVDAGMPGCIEDVACFSGPRSCNCTSGECKTPAGACWPDGDCPPAVRKQHPDAKCVRLAPGEIGIPLYSGQDCLCGCGGCMAVCDGKGPVFGVLYTQDFASGWLPPILDVGAHLPSKGKLGFYIRARGPFPKLNLIVGNGDATQFSVLQYYYADLAATGDFDEQIVFDLNVADPDAGLPYEWKKSADKPTIVLLLPPGDENGNGVVFEEIDCIVPFYEPAD